MRRQSLIPTFVVVVGVLALSGCGARGDPAPNQRRPPAPCVVRAINLRTIEAILPTKDIQGNLLPGIEAVRVYYLPMSADHPSALDVFQRGEAIMERRRPDIPGTGKKIIMDLSHFGRSSGWLVVVPFRVGNIPGAPSQILPWFDPAF